MIECENCPNETFNDSCSECGCNLCDCKILIEGKSFCDLCLIGKKVHFAGASYEVAEIADFPHGRMLGIYDEPPTKHIDFIKSQNVKVIR
jgi:hypothetical protein